jgi:hypothetical protein
LEATGFDATTGFGGAATGTFDDASATNAATLSAFSVLLFLPSFFSFAFPFSFFSASLASFLNRFLYFLGTC